MKVFFTDVWINTMKRMCSGSALLVLALMPFEAFAQSTKSRPLNFRGDITAEQIVNRTCVVEATEEGQLVTTTSGIGKENLAYKEMSANANVGKMGKIKVKTGGLAVSLTTSKERLVYRETEDSDPEQMNNVVLTSGIFQNGEERSASKLGKLGELELRLGAQRNPVSATEELTTGELEALKAKIRIGKGFRADRNTEEFYDVWFTAVLINPHTSDKIFKAGEYTGYTTVTCEPAPAPPTS